MVFGFRFEISHLRTLIGETLVRVLTVSNVFHEVLTDALCRHQLAVHSRRHSLVAVATAVREVDNQQPVLVADRLDVR